MIKMNSTLTICVVAVAWLAFLAGIFVGERHERQQWEAKEWTASVWAMQGGVVHHYAITSFPEGLYIDGARVPEAYELNLSPHDHLDVERR